MLNELWKTFNFSICEDNGKFCIPRSNCSLLELSSTSISGNSFEDSITGSTAITESHKLIKNFDSYLMCFIGKYSQNVFKDLIRPKVTRVIVGPSKA